MRPVLPFALPLLLPTKASRFYAIPILYFPNRFLSNLLILQAHLPDLGFQELPLMFLPNLQLLLALVLGLVVAAALHLLQLLKLPKLLSVLKKNLQRRLRVLFFWSAWIAKESRVTNLLLPIHWMKFRLKLRGARTVVPWKPPFAFREIY
jgi:hypothetical protein